MSLRKILQKTTDCRKKIFYISRRLTHQKNFSYLIDEFYEFTKINFDYDLYIFGEGEDRKNYKNK